MCEKRARKAKRSSLAIRLREERRLQRIQRLNISAPVEVPRPPCAAPRMMDKAVQKRVLLELAWKTVHLMQRNTLIQQKIVALQKETSEFVAKVMSDPENQKRYQENIRICKLIASQQKHPQPVDNTLPLTVEPEK